MRNAHQSQEKASQQILPMQLKYIDGSPYRFRYART